MQADACYVAGRPKTSSSSMRQPALSRTEPRGASCSGGEGSGIEVESRLVRVNSYLLINKESIK